MEGIAHICIDWTVLGPSDGCVAANCLPEVLDRAHARILDSSAPGQCLQVAFNMLESLGHESMGEEIGPSLLESMLTRGIGSSDSSPSVGSPADCSRTQSSPETMHFLRFWQAWAELHRRLGEGYQGSDEPLLEEVNIFRDALIRRASSEGSFTTRTIWAELSTAEQMSFDKAAWSLLRDLVWPSCKKKGLWSGSSSSSPSDASEVLVEWLSKLSADYLEGPRAELIRNVRNVTQCSMRDACVALGMHDWDFEAALYFVVGKGVSVPAGTKGCSISSWCSHGAKLRQHEVDCPICCEGYTESAPRVVTQCCYQVLCKSCENRLGRPTGFPCPFCRKVVGQPGRTCLDPQITLPRGHSFMGLPVPSRASLGEVLGGVRGVLATATGEASRAVTEMVAALREEEAPPLVSSSYSHSSRSSSRRSGQHQHSRSRSSSVSQPDRRRSVA
mmetsp:Transcript_49433/g.105236  ORF Transcript_49433/g.105236 Transcript_49433/m.105236 type:complete len:445 (+) Transcript_49433:59-1393(+)